MKKTSKFLIWVNVNIFTGLFLVSNAFAQGNIDYQIPNPSKYSSLEEIINAGASLIRPAFLLTFGGMILLGASLILTSQGDEEKIATAKKTIVAAIIGFIIAVFAPSILNFVLNFLGVDGL